MQHQVFLLVCLFCIFHIPLQRIYHIVSKIKRAERNCTGLHRTKPNNYLQCYAEYTNVFQRCLGIVLQWKQENGLRLNLDKTEVLRVGAHIVGGLGDSRLGGDPCRKEWCPQLGDPSGPGAHHGNSGASVVHTAFFHLWRIVLL